MLLRQGLVMYPVAGLEVSEGQKSLSMLDLLASASQVCIITSSSYSAHLVSSGKALGGTVAHESG